MIYQKMLIVKRQKAKELQNTNIGNKKALRSIYIGSQGYVIELICFDGVLWAVLYPVEILQFV